MTGFPADEVARRADTTPEMVSRCQALGLLAATDGPDTVERVRLVELLARRGISPETVADVERAQPGMLGHFVEMLYPTQDWPVTPLEEAATALDLDLALTERIWEVAGRAEQGDWLTAEDVEGMRGLSNAIGAGFPSDALLQMVRVYADALSRVAESEARLFHFYVHEQLHAPGASFDEVVAATTATRDHLQDLTEPAIRYFHRRGMVKAIREDAFLHIAEDAGITPPTEVAGQLPVAMLFMDLASFTALTDAMGDAAAATVLDRFSDLVRRAANRCGGRVVKQIGDAFMVVFVDTPSALRCGCDVARSSAEEPQFPGVRMGLHAGPVLYREGDYYGATVNLAARVAGEATMGQLLVTAAVRQASGGIDDVEFVSVGSRSLKGISEPVELYEVRRGGPRVERRRDPVCGMGLSVSEVGAELSLGGARHVFCSEPCLQRFVTDPSRYGGFETLSAQDR